MKATNAIELDNVTKSFKLETRGTERSMLSRKKGATVSNKVLDGITLSVKKGEVLGILGRNGSGKSTLLSLMARILEPDSGTVRVDGKVASILSLSMGFQHEMTGRENIYLKGELYGISRKDMEERIEGIIDFSGIRKYIDNPIKTYSSGMVSRLAFSIMLNVEADVMLVDEVLSTGDASFSVKASNAFKSMMRDKKTVVFVSHNISAVEEMCSRVIWLDSGKIVAEGDPKSICSRYSAEMSQSFDVVREQALAGVASAQYDLALMYRDGRSVEADQEQYAEWLKKAADQGHTEAQVAYADILFDSGSESARSEAMIFYQSAADKGNAAARSKLATISGGSADDPDRKEILELCRKLAESGNPADVTRYAAVLLKTAWNEEDRREAYRQYLKAAEGGNPDVYYQLSMMSGSGIGTAKDPKEQMRMLEMAAEAGHQKAISTLADMYRDGKRVERDSERAFSLYLKGAEQGVASCQYQVACMYRDGEGVERNQTEAERWFRIYSRAVIAQYQVAVAEALKGRTEPEADAGELLSKSAECYNHKGLALAAASLRSGGSGAPDREKAKEAYLKAAESPGQSVIALADMYYEGALFDQDYGKAAELYLRSAYLLDAQRQYRLYVMLSKGLGVPKDEEEARRYLRMAASRGYRDAIVALAGR